MTVNSNSNDETKSESASSDETSTTNNESALPKNSKKLENAKAKLPPLSVVAQRNLDSLVNGVNDDGNPELSLTDLESLSLHLAFYARAKRTLAANDAKVTLNQVVRVVSGNADIVGKVGTIVRLARIRCYVEVDGKQHYVFTSDVVPVSNETVETLDDEATAGESFAQEQAASA